MASDRDFTSHTKNVSLKGKLPKSLSNHLLPNPLSAPFSKASSSLDNLSRSNSISNRLRDYSRSEKYEGDSRSSHKLDSRHDFKSFKEDSGSGKSTTKQPKSDLREIHKLGARDEARPEFRLSFHRETQIDSRRQKHSAPHRVPKPAFDLGTPIKTYSSRFTANDGHVPLRSGPSAHLQSVAATSESSHIETGSRITGSVSHVAQEKAAPLYKSFFSDDRRRKSGVKCGREYNRDLSNKQGEYNRDISNKQGKHVYSSRELSDNQRTQSTLDRPLKLTHISNDPILGHWSRDQSLKSSSTDRSSHESTNATYGRRSASPSIDRQRERSKSPGPHRGRRLSSSDQYHRPSRSHGRPPSSMDNEQADFENHSSRKLDIEQKSIPSLAPVETFHQNSDKKHFELFDSSMLEAFGPEMVSKPAEPVVVNAQLPRTSFAEYLKRSKLNSGLNQNISDEEAAHSSAVEHKISMIEKGSTQHKEVSGDSKASSEAVASIILAPPPVESQARNLGDLAADVKEELAHNAWPTRTDIATKPIQMDAESGRKTVDRESIPKDEDSSELAPPTPPEQFKTGTSSILFKGVKSKGQPQDNDSEKRDGVQLDQQITLPGDTGQEPEQRGKLEESKESDESQEPDDSDESEETDIAPIGVPRTPQPVLTADDSDRTHLSPHASEISMLSPIHDNADEVDFNFNDLATIKEMIDGQLLDEESDKEDSGNDSSEISEAETIVGDFPETPSIGSVLARKQGRDETRRRLKRNSAALPRLSSDDEELRPRRSNRSNPALLQASSDEEEQPLKNSSKRAKASSADVNPDETDANSDAGLSIAEAPKSSALPLLQQPYKMRRNAGGVSLLQRACKRGDIEDARNFLDRGASANEKDFCGFTCLHEAALKGHLDIVKLLIEHDAQVNAKSDEAGHSETALFDAAENKHVDVVRYLLDAGADPSVTNLQGLTALTKIFLDHADEDGYTEIVALLRNDDVPNQQQSESATASSGLMDPVDDPNDEYFRSLTKKKGILRFAASGAKEITANYFVAGNTLSQKPDMLFLAARNGHAELIDIILGLDPGSFDIDTENSVGCTVLIASVGRGHYEVVESLLEKKADPHKRRNGDGLNALEIAQRSVEYDPREVALIREFMGLENCATEPEESEAAKAEPIVKPLGESTKFQDSISVKRRLSEDLAVKSPEAKRVKSSLVDDRFSEDVSIENHRLNSSPEPFAELNNSNEDEVDAQCDDSIGDGGDPCPIANDPNQAADKAQDEHHRAEEARIWQQKVEAKKQARREIFIKTEREKERKRKEEEEVYAAERERVAREAELLRLEAEKRAREEAEVIEAQRQVLRREMIVSSYPVGLRSFRAGSRPTRIELARFTPIYVFNIAKVDCVVDLQLVFLTGFPQADLLRQTAVEQVAPLDAAAKSKVWQLFEPMINYAHDDPSPEDPALFQNLDLNFVGLELVEAYVKLDFPELEQAVWTEKRLIKVDLNTLRPSTIMAREIKSAGAITSHLSKRFVPPKLQARKDAVLSIGVSSRTIW